MGDITDSVYKLINTVTRTHPFNTLRAAELQSWITDGEYDRILRGEYTHRGQEEEERSLGQDIGDAAAHYTKTAKETVSDVANAAKRAAQAFSEAFKESGKK
jgi:hypothetical protein